MHRPVVPGKLKKFHPHPRGTKQAGAPYTTEFDHIICLLFIAFGPPGTGPVHFIRSNTQSNSTITGTHQRIESGLIGVQLALHNLL